MSKGDVITTSKGPRTTEGEVPTPEAEEPVEDRWAAVGARIAQMGGVDLNNYGTVVYNEGDISDEDVAKLDADLEKAGAAPGMGRAAALAARQMGVTISFTARKAAKAEEG